MVDRDDLLRWADTVPARVELPRLMRRLVLETVPDATGVLFPGGTGTSVGGWDGAATSAAGTAFVPAGRSGWELSAGKPLAPKADEDYGKRTAAPDGSPAGGCVYVQVILRAWQDRATWAGGKRGGPWKDVLAYGVDDVEAWLEQAPVTHAWLSELRGYGPYGYRAAESWWRDWAGATSPPLPPEALLAGRQAAATALLAVLAGPASVVTVSAGSTDETLAFVAAALDLAARDGDAAQLARTAFVDDPASWRALAGRTGPLVLVAASPQAAAEAAASGIHHVVVPVQGAARPDVDVPPVEAAAAGAALLGAGLGEEPARDAGRLARRSVLALRRRLAVKPELHAPAWATAPSRAVRGLLLSGAWDERHDADRAAVTALCGGGYDDLIETAAALAAEPDPFVEKIGPAWTVVSGQDAWTQMAPAVRGDDLDRLDPVVAQVLGERPGGREHSAELRRGLAGTLALLGVHGAAVAHGSSDDGAAWASWAVRRVLRAATEEAAGGGWAGLADVLPLLAEAAPDAFLDELRDASAGAAPAIAGMFADGAQGLGAASPHSWLLWALETLAWSPEHFGAAVQALARLAEIDPGGRMTNRPAQALRSVLSAWAPQTTAPADRRLAALDAVRRDRPEVAWPLALSLLMGHHETQIRTPGPQYRDWKNDEPAPPGPGDIARYTDALVERLARDAGSDPRRWAALVGKLPRLPLEHRVALVTVLDELLREGSMAKDGLGDLWEALRSLAAQHRRWAQTDWALPADETDALAALADRTAPADPVAASTWLFAGRPDVGGPELVDDFDAYDARLAELRRDAVAAAADAGGLDDVRRLAAAGDMPEAVGVALAGARGDDDADRLLPMLALDPSDGAPESKDARLAWGWAAARHGDGGWPWADDACARDLPAVSKARVLLGSRDYPRAWEAADALGPDVALHYWLGFNIYSLGRDLPHAERVCRALTAAGRVTHAVHLAAMTLRRGPDIHDRPAFLTGVLKEWIAAAADDPEAAHAEPRHFEEILAWLAANPPEGGAGQEIALLEWQLMPVLGYRADLAAVGQALTADPSLYVQLLNGVYRADAGPAAPGGPTGPPGDAGDASVVEEPPPGDAADNDAYDDGAPGDGHAGTAVHGYRLLSAYRGLPGLRPDGTVDGDALAAWVARVLSAAEASGRGEIAEIHVGEVLANAPDDPDGTWPCRPVRDLLEALQNTRVERGLMLRVMNRRGVTVRGVEDGGAQETDLADEYRARAAAVADAWPRSAAVLRALAQSYDADGRQQEASAERTRRGHDR